jgi:hypothetical protein
MFRDEAHRTSDEECIGACRLLERSLSTTHGRYLFEQTYSRRAFFQSALRSSAMIYLTSHKK